MNIVYRHPWHANELRQAFGRLLGDVETTCAETAWSPRVDIREDDKCFVILADIPGVEPQDIEVSMDKGVLSIRGARTSETSAAGNTLKRSERQQGAFERRFELPDSADAQGIAASGKHGVLEISIPKKAESAPRKIQVAH